MRRSLLLLVCLTGCTVGVVPRDSFPPEPAAEPAADAAPAADVAPARREYTLDGNRLVLPSPIAFETAGVQLTPASEPALEHVRSYLTDKDYITTMRVEGHADDQALSEARAVAVARWLVAHGIDCKRLIAVGFGPTKPIAAAGSPENDRVELHNAALRNLPIGGAAPDGGGQVAATDLCR